MTEIKVTVNGQSQAAGASAGAAEPSSRAPARDEGSSAPRPGQPASTAPSHASSAGSPSAFSASSAASSGQGPGATAPAASAGAGQVPGTTAAPGPASEPGITAAPGPASEPGTTAAPGPAGEPGITAAPGPAGEPGITAAPGPASEPHPASGGTPSQAQPPDAAGTDGAGASSSGAGAHEEDAHAAAGNDTPTETDAAEIDGDLTELAKTAKQRDEYLALAQRTQADFENYRKRVAREAAGAQERGVCRLAKELLPALDNLDRAIGAAAQDDPLLEGVRLVRSELAAALARAGIESFSPLGEEFDPSVHEAVATAAQAADGKASGTVVEVYQPGYRMRESVIRPARVVVAA